jgi:hypothetical protein
MNIIFTGGYNILFKLMSKNVLLYIRIFYENNSLDDSEDG